MKVCPYCAEELDDDAVVCRQCGRDATVPPSWKAVPRRPDEPPWWKDPGADPWAQPRSESLPVDASFANEAPFAELISARNIPQETNKLAVASAFFGVLGGGLLAVILGHVAKRQIDRSEGRQGGLVFAMIGIILGWTEIAIVLAVGIPITVSVLRHHDIHSYNADVTVAANLHRAADWGVDCGYFADGCLGVTASALNAQGFPLVTYVDAPAQSTGPTVISVHPVSRYVWAAAALSDSGRCYYIRVDTRGTRTFGVDVSGERCSGIDAIGASETRFPLPSPPG